MKRFHSCRQTGIATPRAEGGSLLPFPRLRRDAEIYARFTDNSAALQPLPRRKSVKVEREKAETRGKGGLGAGKKEMKRKERKGLQTVAA